MKDDERTLIVKRMAEVLADEIHAIYQRVLNAKDEQIAALEEELDEALSRIDHPENGDT